MTEERSRPASESKATSERRKGSVASNHGEESEGIGMKHNEDRAANRFKAGLIKAKEVQ
ncbi:hypothetical protein TUMSATVNIG3_33950 [Vibrio nigripulchritudo]|nr:hypothetical protein TUMSATVNIG2_33460 [Vibrio nigripulchritudo]BDU44597.1 hypothetical protein TUMSATVNIG3_33950 [Vibrio nigripulchritudo]